MKRRTGERRLNTFRHCVADVLDTRPSQVRAESRWREDLDADSLVVVALNDAFSIKIADVDPEELMTVGQGFDLVAELVGVQSGVS